MIFLPCHLVSNILYLDGVHHLGRVQLDGVVDPARLEARHLAHGVLKLKSDARMNEAIL